MTHDNQEKKKCCHKKKNIESSWSEGVNLGARSRAWQLDFRYKTYMLSESRNTSITQFQSDGLGLLRLVRPRFSNVKRSADYLNLLNGQVFLW